MDIGHYRRSEALARQFMPSWRVAQVHSPNVFRAVGYPVQVESTADLVPLLNTMHEDRFLAYQEELGGLTEEEFDQLGVVFADFARFAYRTFHSGRVELPLSVMLAHYSLCTKLCGWTDEDVKVLEIGPGCGYLSFFVPYSDISTYVQIETTESPYVLQHLVNAFCFPDGADEYAIIDPSPDHVTCAVAPESPPTVWVQGTGRCVHLPWWRIGDARRWSLYDIVTTNANLTEFSEAAFIQYADLIRSVLDPNGALIVQDFGGGPLDIGTIMRYLHSIGFAPLVLVEAKAFTGKQFATPNAVFVREGHPQFESLHRGVTFDTFPTDDPAVRRMFRLDDIGPRRNYTGDEIAERVNIMLGV